MTRKNAKMKIKRALRKFALRHRLYSTAAFNRAMWGHYFRRRMVSQVGELHVTVNVEIGIFGLIPTGFTYAGRIFETTEYMDDGHGHVLMHAVTIDQP